MKALRLPLCRAVPESYFLLSVEPPEEPVEAEDEPAVALAFGAPSVLVLEELSPVDAEPLLAAPVLPAVFLAA